MVQAKCKPKCKSTCNATCKPTCNSTSGCSVVPQDANPTSTRGTWDPLAHPYQNSKWEMALPVVSKAISKIAVANKKQDATPTCRCVLLPVLLDKPSLRPRNTRAQVRWLPRFENRILPQHLWGASTTYGGPPPQTKQQKKQNDSSRVVVRFTTGLPTGSARPKAGQSLLDPRSPECPARPKAFPTCVRTTGSARPISYKRGPGFCAQGPGHFYFLRIVSWVPCATPPPTRRFSGMALATRQSSPCTGLV